MKIEIVDGFKMLSDISRKPTLVIESDSLTSLHKLILGEDLMINVTIRIK